MVEKGIHGQRLWETDMLLSLDGPPLTRHLQPLDVHAQALGQLANQKSRATGSHITYFLCEATALEMFKRCFNTGAAGKPKVKSDRQSYHLLSV